MNDRTRNQPVDRNIAVMIGCLAAHQVLPSWILSSRRITVPKTSAKTVNIFSSTMHFS